MQLSRLFEKTKEIDEILDGELLEISVRQHQVTISLEKTMITFEKAQKLFKAAKTTSDSFISINNNVLYLTIGDLSDKIGKKHIFYPFISTIKEIAENICTCPALEFVISTQYMKCYLDKPGLKVVDLVDYEDILQAPGKAELELHPQRPYLLFINEDQEV